MIFCICRTARVRHNHREKILEEYGSRKTLHIAFSIAALTCAGVVSAGTITVDAGGGGDHTTIQAAINAAVTGDIVEIIDSGTYVEDLQIYGQGITLISPHPGGESTALWILGVPEAPTGAPASVTRSKVVPL